MYPGDTCSLVPRNAMWLEKQFDFKFLIEIPISRLIGRHHFLEMDKGMEISHEEDNMNVDNMLIVSRQQHYGEDKALSVSQGDQSKRQDRNASHKRNLHKD